MDKIAVLIPCYNESKTIVKVVEDFKRVIPEAVIYVYDNNSMMERTSSQEVPVRSYVMNISREKEMLFEECSVKLMRNVIS